MTCEWCPNKYEVSQGTVRQGPFLFYTIDNNNMVIGGISDYMYSKYSQLLLCDKCDMDLEVKTGDFSKKHDTLLEQLKSNLIHILEQTMLKIATRIQIHVHLDYLIAEYAIE